MNATYVDNRDLSWTIAHCVDILYWDYPLVQ